MMNRKPAPLPIHPEDELDIQIGTGLVAVMVTSGIQKIRDLRSALAEDRKNLPLVRVRDNPTLAPFSFLLHDAGRLKGDGDFVTIGDILQSLSRSARRSAIGR